MGVYARVMKELLKENAAPEKPDLSDIYAAGSLIGLDKNDVERLYRRGTSSGVKLLVTKYWYIFFPVEIFIAALFLFLLTGNPPTQPSGLYGHPIPPGGVQPMYSVTTKRDLKKRIFRS
ncbi:MAG: hypothetical protein WED04_11075 [Promethearchaeati archaeon SRVP18_Atabeyarchaeia-1]